jgi:uncharacterized protein (TIGR00266 family)
MKVTTAGPNAFQTAKVELDSGESFYSEAGKLVRMSSNIELDVQTHTKGSSGIMGAMKRLFAGNSLFISHYRAKGAGEVVLSPTLSGNLAVIDMDGKTGWYSTGGSYLGNSSELSLTPKWQGMSGLLSGESMVFMHATGVGKLLVDAFGIIHTEQCEGSFVVDTGHVVAFEDTLQFEITKVGGSWITSFLSGEGFVIRFKGSGRIMIQSHNPNSFGQAVGPKLPPRG